MRFLIPILMLVPNFAQGGWWRSFCEKHLIAEDPYPFADEDCITLIDTYFLTHDHRLLDEVVYRLRAGMLTTHETQYFWLKFGNSSPPGEKPKRST